MNFLPSLSTGCFFWIVTLLVPVLAIAQDFEREPIDYGRRTPSDRVTKLADDLQSGKKSLEHEPHFGYLKSLLTELEVPPSSQTLVFSKTSLQRDRISPRTPRSLYFSDDAYVGFCQDGDVLEISAVDDDLGAVFYTLDQNAATKPRIVRQTDNCLVCHGSSSTKGVPGHLLRSVYSDSAGFPILSSGSHRTDHSSPLAQRWGGWYVTGDHGEQRHLGNLIVRGRAEPEEVDNSAGQNVADLSKLISTEDFLTPHSDIVALMVLAHQVDAHNCITQANFGTLEALHHERALNRDLGKPADERWDSTNSRIKSVCEPLVECLLFFEEIPLTDRIAGTSGFADDFQRRGPRDKQGRSLRELDMNSRMFKYPCSYLVHSPSFAALPAAAREYVFRRMRDVLSGNDSSDKFRRLSPDDREAVGEILCDTLPGYAAAKPNQD